MEPLHTDIEQATLRNRAYRRVLYTDKHCQVVLMKIQPGEEIGAERHRGVTQFFRVEKGTGVAEINGEEYVLREGDALTVPAGALHNVTCTGRAALRLYTVYCGAPTHPAGAVEMVKREE